MPWATNCREFLGRGLCYLLPINLANPSSSYLQPRLRMLKFNYLQKMQSWSLWRLERLFRCQSQVNFFLALGIQQSSWETCFSLSPVFCPSTSSGSCILRLWRTPIKTASLSSEQSAGYRTASLASWSWSIASHELTVCRMPGKSNTRDGRSPDARRPLNRYPFATAVLSSSTPLFLGYGEYYQFIQGYNQVGLKFWILIRWYLIEKMAS